MSNKTLADLNIDVKEIWLNRIVDRTTNEIVQEFDPPVLWWKEGDSVFESYEKVIIEKS